MAQATAQAVPPQELFPLLNPMGAAEVGRSANLHYLNAGPLEGQEDVRRMDRRAAGWSVAMRSRPGTPRV